MRQHHARRDFLLVPQQLPAFVDIVFDQFKARLKDHQLAATKRVHIWQFKNSSIFSMTEDSI
jgi:hypothetical protein